MRLVLESEMTSPLCNAVMSSLCNVYYYIIHSCVSEECGSVKVNPLEGIINYTHYIHVRIMMYGMYVCACAVAVAL